MIQLYSRVRPPDKRKKKTRKKQTSLAQGTPSQCKVKGTT